MGRPMTGVSVSPLKSPNVSTDNINDIDQGIAGGSLLDGVAVKHQDFDVKGLKICKQTSGRVYQLHGQTGHDNVGKSLQGRTGPEAPTGRHLKSLPHKPLSLPSSKYHTSHLPHTKTRAGHDKRTRRGPQIISKKSYFTYPLVTFRTRSG